MSLRTDAVMLLYPRNPDGRRVTVPAAKKFGVFTGVFTPSVLTILGVIMYLRLPMIVGAAGILGAIGIIAIAHVISITTGLSVSSIATDKRVKAGGTYFMISRSLGLPIGGTLGLALFVGLSFSVSLYVIGFSESFLAFWGFEVSKNAIRIAGTTTLMAVTTVTFISTALALKTQYYILTAIVLSLLSIFLGQHDLGTASVSSIAPVPFIVLFGIFFPAVTGFEAGVSMSGDLHDPKKSIPLGTISAIAVGLVVYICLAVFLGRTVNADVLQTNSNVLLDIALVPQLVVAGVWGATISSAFGSILGAPRILQATASDQITPRFFAHGHGRDNEPRRAMLLTFAIAEGGILIGELDVIARVVSMFFITTYGFLNLTAAIEGWVSPDFRPEFRVPKFVSIIGAVACFVVMIQLDLLAMIGSSVVLGAVYLYLARKQLTLQSGDTWEGVWSSLARGALRRLSTTVQHRRNWRPNILQFGKSEEEPELLEFASTLAEHGGLLTNVQVVTTGTEFPRRVVRKEPQRGTTMDVFHRVIEAPNRYEGIATVAGLYGFSGIDPNTVMLRWPDDVANNVELGSLIRRLAAMDHNLLFLRLGAHGFGERKRLDIWWSGYGRNIGLALALVRFLTTSDEWPLTDVRFFVVNQGHQSMNETITRALRGMLAEYRIEGVIKVISNGLEQRRIPDILAAESAATDLAIVGLPDNVTASPQAALRAVERVVGGLPTTLMIRASSFFPETSVIPSTTRVYEGPDDAGAEPTIPDLTIPDESALVPAIHSVDEGIRRIGATIGSEFTGPTLGEFRGLLQSIESAVVTTFTNLTEAIEGDERRKQARALDRIQSAFLFHAEEMLQEFSKRELGLQADRFAELMPFVNREWAELLKATPATVTASVAGQRSGLASLLRRKRRRIKLRRRIESELRLPVEMAVFDTMRDAEFTAQASTTTIGVLIRRVNDGIAKIQAAHDRQEEDLATIVGDEQDAVSASVVQAVHAIEHSIEESDRSIVESGRKEINRVVRHLNSVVSSKRPGWRSRKRPNYLRDVADICSGWLEGRERELNEASLTVKLSAFSDRLETVVKRGTGEVMLEIANNYLDPLSKVSKEVQRLLERSRSSKKPKLIYEGTDRFEGLPVVESLLEEIGRACEELPESVELPVDANAGELGEPAVGTLPVRDAVTFIVETEFSAPFRDAVEATTPRFEAASNVVHDVVQLARFYVDRADEGAATDETQFDSSFAKDGLERLEAARSDIEAQRESLEDLVRERLRACRDALHGAALRRAAAQLGRHEREKRGRDFLALLTRPSSRVAIELQRRIVRLQYRRSEGVLLARRLGLSGPRANDGVERLRDLIDGFYPAGSILDQIPSYYRQLFLGRLIGTATNRPGRRSSEIAEATELLERHDEGASGAIAIVGAPRSGRSTIMKLLTGRLTNRDMIHYVHAPPGGSCDPQVFLRQFGMSLGRSGDLHTIMRGLQDRRTIVFDDLELWWQRREGGDAVLEMIVDLIAHYGERHLVITTASDRSYALIDKLCGLGPHVLGAVGVRAFDAEDLKEAILTRHESTGLTYVLRGLPEAELSEWRVANLFNRFFRYCRGNVGDAMHAWISHIESARSGSVTIRTPEPRSTDSFEMLTPRQVGLIGQLLLHRQMTRLRLADFPEARDLDVDREVGALAAMRIFDTHRDVLSINPFVEPHLIRHFADGQHL